MSKAKLVRVAAVGIALSAVYYADKVREEGFTKHPVIPVEGDRPTIGFGSTYYEDGKPVAMTDSPITRDRAWSIVQAHNAKEQAEFNRTLDGVLLFQPEYELFFGWRYQYGIGRWKTSGMLRNLKRGERFAACNSLLEYKFMHSSKRPLTPNGWVVSKRDASGQPVQWRFDCSTPGNKVCRGVHDRNLRRHTECTKYAAMDTLPSTKD